MKAMQTRNTPKGEIKYLKNHIRYKNGNSQTVCVSSVLSFFGITPDMYKYTSTRKNMKAYENVLRKNGCRVMDRSKHFRNCKTVNKVIDSMEYFIDPVNRKADTAVEVYYIIYVRCHIFLIDRNGAVMIDTAPTWAKGDKRRVLGVTAVIKKS